VSSGIQLGDDGLARCAWAGSDAEYRRYHDEEWGVPLHGDRALFEKLSLEGFQAGLSWITILRKRPRFREAFAGFEPETVAAFGDADIERLMADAGIVRNDRQRRPRGGARRRRARHADLVVRPDTERCAAGRVLRRPARVDGGVHGAQP
jgi:DNA-3-methyladenine glycosylase I